jgi:hypothetical protein
MPITAATDLAGRLASTIQSCDFEAAQPLIAEYGAAIRGQLRSASPQERQLIFDQALETLNEHLRLARLMRSHMHLRLRQLSGESLYNSQRQSLHTWHLDG